MLISIESPLQILILENLFYNFFINAAPSQKTLDDKGEWESQIFAICYRSAQISCTVPSMESSGSSGGSRGAEQ